MKNYETNVSDGQGGALKYNALSMQIFHFRGEYVCQNSEDYKENRDRHEDIVEDVNDATF